jgi:hypothetical protein
MDEPTYLVTWVDGEGRACCTDGALLLVDRDQVIVTHGEKAVCCIPRESVTLIERTTAAPSVASGASSSAIAPTTSAASATPNGTVLDVSGNWMFEGDY